MSTNPEQDGFQDLKRLLALKRHERPPPGYFDTFSREVIARIRTEERVNADDLLSHVEEHAPWLARFWSAMQTKPLLAGAFGAAVCGLLVAGLILSGRVDPAPVAALPAEPQTLVQADNQAPDGLFKKASATGSSTEGLSSIQPQAARSSVFQGFNQPASPLFQTLEYKTGGNN